MMALVSFATSKLGIGILIAAAVAIGLAWTFMEGKEAGAASAAALAAAEAARRIAAANKARDAVKHDRKAVEHDPRNRDRW